MRASIARVAAVLGSASMCISLAACGGASSAASLNVTSPTNVALSLTCSATPTSGVAPLTVSLAVQMSPANSLVSIQYGDGTSGTDPNAVHVYQTAGSFSLVVTATSGSQHASCQNAVSVLAPPTRPVDTPPSARFRTSPNPPTGSAPLDVTLNMCGSQDPDGDSLSFSYDFGDGTSAHSHLCRDEHVYSAGTFTSKMCVTDGQPGHEVCHSDLIQVQ